MRQPLANDLRTVLSALSIANDLERMGDHATNIAKRVANVKINMPDTPVSEIVNMGENVQRMIKNVLDAFVQKSDTLAINAWDLDGDIDELYLSIYRDLLKTMAEDPDTITGCSHLLSIAKNIERIGDYVQNIAEDIHFITTGQALERKSEKRIKWEKV
jgi:phosphate transport system protein